MGLCGVHVRGCRDGFRHERTRFHNSSCRSADRTAAFAGRALGFSAGATPLCDLPGLLGWHHPGVGLAGNLGGGDKARSEAMRTPFSLALNVAVLLGGLPGLGLEIKYRRRSLLGLSPI